MNLRNKSNLDNTFDLKQFSTNDALRSMYMTNKKAPNIYDSFFKSTLKTEMQNTKKSFFM